MVRSLALIVSAILLTRPGMPTSEAEVYAKVLQAEAKEHGFDPLTGVAMIHFESGWHPQVVSDNGEDYGLGQIRARYVGACRKDEDPLNAPSPECKAVKESLLDAETNIREMARLITENRKLCKAKTGAAPFHRWLASYQGLNFPKEGKWCQPNDKTWRVIRYRKHLIRELSRPKPPAKKAPEKKKPAS